MSAGQPHEWERLDQGIAYCIRCPAISPYHNDTKCMSADPRNIPAIAKLELEQLPSHAFDERKPAGNVKVELQKVRRELLTLASRVEKLAESQETA